MEAPTLISSYPTAVVVLNYNGIHWLEKFLPILVEKTPTADLFVADNNSTDNSIEWVKTNYPLVKVIALANNSGYTGGYNQALSQIEARYYVLINSDIEVTDNWLPLLEDQMNKQPSIGALQPKILSFSESHKFEYAGASGGFIDSFGYPFCRGRIFQDLEVDQNQYDEPIECFWASGACLMVRAEAFHKVGGLCTEFFAHMEEIDLCWRLQIEGYKVGVLPSSKVYHVGGGTLSQNSPQKTYLNFRNNWLMLIRNQPSKNILAIALPRLVLDGIAGVKFFIFESPAHGWAVARSHFYIYGNISRLLRERKQQSSKLKLVALPSLKGLVLWHYFVKGRKTFSQLNFKTKPLKVN